MERYIRIKDFPEKYGIPRTTVYYWLKTSDFPRPIKIGARRVIWSVEEVEAWINKKRQETKQK